MFGLDCSVGSCGVGGDGLMELDCGACQGSLSGTASPGGGTTLEERQLGALVAD